MRNFSSRARPELVEEARRIAEVEGLKFQTVLYEVLTEWVEREKDSTVIEVWLRGTSRPVRP